MIIVEFEGVEIDFCTRCGGSWLDAGELVWIAELAGVEAGPMSRAIDGAGSGGRTKRRCPRCPRRLKRIKVGGDPAVELERCPWGHGLWFDAGEIGVVIRAFHVGEGGEVARLMVELHRHELEARKS